MTVFCRDVNLDLQSAGGAGCPAPINRDADTYGFGSFRNRSKNLKLNAPKSHIFSLIISSESPIIPEKSRRKGVQEIEIGNA